MLDAHITRNAALFNIYKMKTSIDHVQNECSKNIIVTTIFSSEEIKAGRMREMIMLRGGHKISGKKKMMNNRFLVPCYLRLYLSYR